MAMLRLSLIGILLVLVSVPAQGQERQPENCPKISVAGYGGVVILDQVVSFKAVVSDLPREARLIWTLKGGQLESGQGTTEIGVRATRDDLGDNIIATLRVYGLPIGCHDTATESTPVSYTPISEKLLEIRSFNKDDYRNEFDDVKKSLIDNPNSQGFVIVNVREGDTEEQLRSRERLVVESLNLGSVKINRSRITMKRRPDQPTDSIEIWRVPPGAADPLCEGCEPSPKETKQGCPTISIIEPQGVSRTGDIAEFKLDPEISKVSGLQFLWSVSAGTIVRGQGTTAVTVRSDDEDSSKTLIATVSIKGLPPGCESLARGEATLFRFQGDILLDEFSRIPVNDQTGRLDNFAIELSQFPTQVGYVILGYKPGTSNSAILKRVKLIKDHIFGFRKLPRNRVVILSELSERETTKIYRLPHDAKVGFCSNCKVH